MPEKYNFKILAPLDCGFEFPSRRSKNEHVYSHYLSSMQRLRSRVYLKDGAIQPCEVDCEGRFIMPGDRRSWHFLLTADSDVIGCARYAVYPSTVTFDRLRIARSPLALQPEWQKKVREAVEADLQRAREQNFSYVEIGGWALAEEWRGTAAALEILVASYALAHFWGGAFGACMATVRHSSSSILRRIGGSGFQVGNQMLPAYEDSRYGCLMELLRFDSRAPAERFVPLINQLRRNLKGATLISPGVPYPRVAVSREFHSEQLSVPRLVPSYS